MLLFSVLQIITCPLITRLILDLRSYITTVSNRALSVCVCALAGLRFNQDTVCLSVCL